ncbi:MAG TPA: hypothetical protein VFP87_10865 [Chitinophagaceae bacterium]|nr:hypothetical protein [Chitinophagaceae bacterium]
MKSLPSILLLITLLILASCSVKLTPRPVAGKLPPGQAKKVAGAQSASSFAPGHNKH